MKVDVSFIPGNLLPQELKDAADQKIEYPYTEAGFIEKTENVLEKSDRTAIFVNNRRRFRENYAKFEENLFDFAREMFRQRNFDLAEKSFRYLVELGSLKAASKEYLLKIYIKQKNTDGIKWVKKRIKIQLDQPYHLAAERRKLKRILGKYFAMP
ncbi:MAG: hypothetical protein SCALA702_12710 [Melioribacteraceae bacterium]|nr:MAG: hypothetical protein SCALA702_12710 [Melioribacteraceae bacterium]